MLPIAMTLALTAVLQAQAPAPAPAPDLSDPEVAHVAVTANSIDIDMAKLVPSHTTNAAVRQFATTMITDHTAVNAQAGALATKLGVTPKDNAVSESLQTGATSARVSLGCSWTTARVSRSPTSIRVAPPRQALTYSTSTAR